MLEQKIIELKKELTEYSALVESMLNKSMQAIIQRDRAVLTEVIEKDEPRANEYENQLDEICANLIAQYEPKAKDLRIVLMGLKMNSDLERMADHTVNIAGSGLFLIETFQSSVFAILTHMAELAAAMLRDSITAFFNEEPELARKVCERDTQVDQLGKQLLAELSAKMGEEQGNIRHFLHLLRISSNLERIADLSTNLCEEIVFIVEGKVIKHHHEERP